MARAEIQLHAAAAYPSWPPEEQKWQSADYDAQFWILSVKRSLQKLGKRYFQTKKRRYTATPGDADALSDVFHRWAAQKIELLGIQTPLLVPIPNSSATPDIENYNCLIIARGISAASGANWPVYSGLRFREALVPSSQGGTRQKETLLQEMVAHVPLPPGHTPVLIDDICTTGGHLFAAQRYLKLPNGTPAVVCGRTVKAHKEKMIADIDEIIKTDWWA